MFGAEEAFGDRVVEEGGAILSGRLGDGGPRVELHTSSGDVEIGRDDMWILSDDAPGVDDPSLAHLFAVARDIDTGFRLELVLMALQL